MPTPVIGGRMAPGRPWWDGRYRRGPNVRGFESGHPGAIPNDRNLEGSPESPPAPAAQRWGRSDERGSGEGPLLWGLC
jgi:hypothetical protein